jgi:hypothetical protein
VTLSNSLKVRAAGATLVAVGLFFLKTSFFDVIAAAERHASSVSTSGKATIMVPAFIVLGAVVALMPAGALAPSSPGPSWLVDRNGRMRFVFWIAIAMLFATGLALHLWLRGRLAELGYG